MTTTPAAEPREDLAVLDAVQRRVLWLATAMVHHANHRRPNPSGIKVGGHQASSASMVSLMTALWFAHLQAPDRVSVKPHASPGAARDQRPARPAGPGLPRAPARVRRPAVLPVADEGPRPRRLLDRVGGHRGDGDDLGRGRPPLPGRARRGPRRRAPDRAARRRRARRGRGAGRPWPTRWCRAWARSCGWSTSTASRWTASCRTSPPGAWRTCSRPPAGTWRP